MKVMTILGLRHSVVPDIDRPDNAAGNDAHILSQIIKDNEHDGHWFPHATF